MLYGFQSILSFAGCPAPAFTRNLMAILPPGDIWPLLETFLVATGCGWDSIAVFGDSKSRVPLTPTQPITISQAKLAALWRPRPAVEESRGS